MEKKKMNSKSRIFVFLMFITLLTLNSLNAGSAVGVLYGSYGESKKGTIDLKIGDDRKQFSWNEVKSKFKGFDNSQAWNLGAIWNVVYEDPVEKNKGIPLLTEITFTGAYDESIVSADKVIQHFDSDLKRRDYSDALSLGSESVKKYVSEKELHDMFDKFYERKVTIETCGIFDAGPAIIADFRLLNGSKCMFIQLGKEDDSWTISSLGEDEDCQRCKPEEPAE
jgi:hypothetical protein